MNFPDAIKYRITKLAKEHDLSIYAVAMASGIPSSTLNDFFRGKVELPRMDTILHISEGFGMELKDFFDDPVFKNIEYDRNTK